MRRALWLGLAALLPLPMLFFASGAVPVGRFLMLGGVCLAVMAFETSRGIAPTLAGVMLGQGLLYLALLWPPAWLAARGLSRLPPRARGAVTFGALALGVLVALAFDVYRTPFAPDAIEGNLLQVYR